MAEESFTPEESRKLAVLIARAWSDSQLAEEYERDPKAVLSGAGIKLRDREAPEMPEKPGDLAMQPMAAAASGSSASSISCATCPCTGCTASCACCALSEEMQPPLEVMMKLAEDPAGRERARELMARWDIKLTAQS